MDRLDQLKSKYQSVLSSMPRQGIQISEVTLQGDKLFVQGFAPTQEAKNAAWDEIKRIDSSYTDLTCDLKVGPPTAGSADVQNHSPESLAGGLANAFRSDQTPAFPTMLSNLFGSSDGQQRAGLLNQILASAGPGLLGAALPGPLASILKGGSTVTPQQAEQISPDTVKNLAEHAEKANPSIIDQVSGFYSQHPKVIQALGAGALAMIMSHASKKQ